MQAELKERAKAALHDYAITLRDQGDHSDVGPRTTIPPLTIPKRLSQSSPIRAASAELQWYREKLIEWRRAGRLTADGTLRVPAGEDPPWTIKRVKSAAPWIKGFDALAVLIELDGVVEEDYMGAHRNIRVAIEEIVDLALERKLAEKLGVIFGRVAEDVKADRGVPAAELSTQSVGGRKNKPHRVRHPETGDLISKEAREAWFDRNPDHQATIQHRGVPEAVAA